VEVYSIVARARGYAAQQLLAIIRNVGALLFAIIRGLTNPSIENSVRQQLESAKEYL
jgi:hypothetical protein